MLVGCSLVVAVFLVVPLIAVAVLDNTGAGGSSIQTVEFGRAGSGCEVTRTADRFPPGTLIRAVAMFSPELQAGERVTISVYRDGTELVDWRDVVPVQEISDCVFVGMTPIDPGRYRVEFAPDTSHMSPASGEFEIAP